jgi:hypothetical protein
MELLDKAENDEEIIKEICFPERNTTTLR